VLALSQGTIAAVRAESSSEELLTRKLSQDPAFTSPPFGFCYAPPQIPAIFLSAAVRSVLPPRFSPPYFPDLLPPLSYHRRSSGRSHPVGHFSRTQDVTSSLFFCHAAFHPPFDSRGRGGEPKFLTQISRAVPAPFCFPWQTAH